MKSECCEEINDTLCFTSARPVFENTVFYVVFQI